MSAISGRRGFIDLEADRDRENRADWAWSAPPRRRLADSGRWSPGWRDRAGSEWCEDWSRLRADAWQRRDGASADEPVSQCRRHAQHYDRPGIRPWARWAECGWWRGTASRSGARCASRRAAVPGVSAAVELADLYVPCPAEPTSHHGSHRCRSL